ncbi:VCBS repeat-containing protein [Streptomyces sp. NPDC020807]|uniref:FG-GAP repeat domain-containing protein n=1 Tax=Streptomyces sp. NPDC020807 TaxID=3155119 RepID=UPI0033EF2125
MKLSRALKGAFVATAVATATATVAGTASAAESATQPTFPMYGVHKTSNDLRVWFPTATGYLQGETFDYDFSTVADVISADNDGDGYPEADWTLYKSGRLEFYSTNGTAEDPTVVGSGWNTYKTVLSPGNIGGAKEADLIGFDKYGVLYSYLGYPTGKLTPRVRVGGGWNVYDQIAGQGDLTGDGKPDIVAKEKSTGFLYLYKGTGDYKAPFAPRQKVGGGWNAYDRLISLGDINEDGKPDLLARKPTGALMRYNGTGVAGGAFKPPVQIGSGYQSYNLL